MENGRKAEQEETEGGVEGSLWTEEMQDVLDRDLAPIQPSHCPAVFFFFKVVHLYLPVIALVFCF